MAKLKLNPNCQPRLRSWLACLYYCYCDFPKHSNSVIGFQNQPNMALI